MWLKLTQDLLETQMWLMKICANLPIQKSTSRQILGLPCLWHLPDKLNILRRKYYNALQWCRLGESPFWIPVIWVWVETGQYGREASGANLLGEGKQRRFKVRVSSNLLFGTGQLSQSLAGHYVTSSSISRRIFYAPQRIWIQRRS